MRDLRVAIAGATGAVGHELLRLLESRDFPVGELRPLASERSRGRSVTFRGRTHEVSVLDDSALGDLDLAFFSAGAERSRRFAPVAARRGAVVVDNSSAFRMKEDVPLVIPEINAGALRGGPGIVANPNCTTIVVLLAVAPLAARAGLRALRVASYQAASGAGAAALRELEEGIRQDLAGEAPAARVFPHPLAFNVIPAIGEFLGDGFTAEERKLVEESRKILSRPGLRVSATCVRVPVRRAHSAAVWLETEREISPEEARRVLADAPGVEVVDDPGRLSYPMPASAAGRNAIEVGRIRIDEANRGPGLTFFVAGDQLLKGAALNAVQIAERMFETRDSPCRPSPPPTSSRASSSRSPRGSSSS